VIQVEVAADELLGALASRADPEFAERTQRYFPYRIRALGVSNAEVVAVARDHFRDRGDLGAPATRLLMTEEVLARAEYHEEVLLGFALLHRVVRTGLDEEVLRCAERWLATCVSNWAQCDDLCLKLLYPFFLGHIEQIPRTRRWAGSPSPWARRAANVAVVKFVRRKVGRTLFELPLAHVFDNCDQLMGDTDPYVRKGCGWLLKVTAEVHPDEVIGFLRARHAEMTRDTFRYAIEKLDSRTRSSLLALGREADR
jgi:3-methyladenine DNA glycosylase AlkD